ncbi:MAG: Hsp70 family protein [Bdellovibrionota bacterium]
MSDVTSIGIDLGTSNSAVAIESSQGLQLLQVPQLTSLHTIGESATLPSALYIPTSEEASSLPRLPWEGEAQRVNVGGIFARERGAQVPDRLVVSAKSWLCNSRVDRKAAILPWQSEITDNKISPFDASKAYLQHLRNAVLSSHPDAPSGRDVVLTVPASFDEVARSLTHEAAAEAGWGEVLLLEEPQAAFYAWLQSHAGDWRERVKPGDVVLVCDLGGGTADFSLISIAERDGDLELVRVSVGEHILLGGDNMDLALAHRLRATLADSGHSLDQWQFLSLVHSARIAKERLLSDATVDEMPIAVQSRSASLFAKTISTRLTRAEVEETILQGFFPLTAVTEMPTQRRSIGLQEMGLDFAFDAALSRHLARFLKRSLASLENASLRSVVPPELTTFGFLRPTAVLFNGGVFKADALRARVLELLRSWCPGEDIRELEGAEYDLAVARGAAYYGAHAKTGQSFRIRSGTARSYYIGIESTQLAVPGFIPPIKGLCVLPQGTEEGSELVLSGNQFGLMVGEAVEFRFFSSSIRAADKVGDMVSDAAAELDESTRLQVTLSASDGFDGDGQIVPVELHCRISELGMLELWMKDTTSEQRWKLEFNVRNEP